jgi:hypothetical protein
MATGCRKDFEGEVNTLQTPETYTIVDAIVRDSNNLLSTTVTAHWWGVAKSGFITGYEVSTDNKQTWSFTKNQSGTFLLNLPVGTDKGNLPIYVRAINNSGQIDPTPAVMVFPVKNTPPVIAFDYSTGRKTSALGAFRYNWIAADVDGEQDIQFIEVVLNDTNAAAYQLPGNTTAASFVASVSNGVFDAQMLVYQNQRTIAQSDKLQGIVFNTRNKIFIRAVDRVGARSRWVTDSIVVKQPVSDFLVVNDYRASATTVGNFYINQIRALGATYQNFDTVQSIIDQLPADAFTTTQVFNFYRRVVWFSDDPNSTLALAQLVTREFFQLGGRMFLVCEIPNDYPYNSSFFGFTPVQQMVVPPAGTTLRMNTGAEMFPHTAGNGWPTLKATSILSSARPFITFSQPSGSVTYDSTCRANLSAQNTSGTTAWTGASNVMSRRLKLSNGKPDMIFLTLPLNRLNGNNNMDSLFRKALVSDLEF